MAGKPVGVMTISLDLETAAYTKAQQKILNESKEAASTINANFQRLGVTSDQIYTAMATRAEAAFRKIGLSSKASLAEVERAYAAMVSSINTSNQQMAKNPLFETLGIRSMAAIEAQKKAVIDSFEAIKTIGFKNHQEEINAVKAKNEQLKILNKEMTGEHEMSMASMTRAVLRWYAAIYVAQAAYQFLSVPFVKGFKAVEEYNTAVASMAAMVVTFGDNMKGLSLEDQWRGALAYSTRIIPVLERIAAATLLSGKETIALANAFARSGVFLDETNTKQIEAFTRISNALPLMTQGQEITRQINTEIRSLMTGMNEQSSMMLITLKAIDPQIEKNMAQWRATDTVLENIGRLLKGFGPATEILEKQWQAVKTSLDTTVTQILRGAMKPAYEDIIALTQELDKWLQTNKQSISDTIEQIRATGKVLKAIYDTAPSGTFEAASMGLIGKILFGNQVGLVIAAVTLINDKLRETNNSLGSIPKKMVDAWDAIKNIPTRPGPQETTVPFLATPALTAQEKANLAVIKIMKMMDETILKNHKESVAEYDKATQLQLSAFKKAGATEEFTNQYLEKRRIIKEQQFQLNKESEKAAEELAKLLEKQRNETEAAFAIWYDTQYKDAEKIGKALSDIEVKGMDERKKLEEKNFTDTEEAWRIYYENLRKEAEIYAKAIGDAKLKELSDAEKVPQTAADEARKMVTFYQDMVGMEDEYRKAKLDWIDKEAAVKFAGMDKEIEKERWMKEQRLKFEQEIFDDKSKKVQQGLGDMAGMFQAISGMYDKSSGEYARMQEAANAMIVLQKAVALVTAVATIANQGLGDPYTAFARIGAMAAAMGALLGSIGMSVGGSAQGVSAAYGQNTTVLGGANNQGSESIGNTWKLLEDTYDLQKHTLTGIYENMKQLNANITGIVKGIILGNVGGAIGDLSNAQSGVESVLGKALTWNYLVPVIDKILGTDFSGKITNYLFGGEVTQTASGLTVRDQGTFVAPYARTTTSGGTFGSDSEQYILQSANADLAAFFGGPHGVYPTFKKGLEEMALKLGGDASIAVNKEFADLDINFAGLDSAGIQKKLSDEISMIGDKFAKEVFGADFINKYIKTNEGAFETIIRLVIGLESVTDILNMTGKSATQNTIALSESLIDLAGGLDKLQAAADTYADKFFDDAEKQSRLQGQLTESLAKVGGLPGSRAGFRGLVDALGEITAANYEAYWTLMKVSGIADEYYSMLEVETEKATKANEDYVASLRNISLSIDAWLNNLSLSDLSPVQSANEWSRQYAEAKAKAGKSGATEQDVGDYLSFATKYLEFQKAYGTSTSYKAIYDAVVGDVTGMQTGKNAALELAQKQLDALNLIVTNTGNAVLAFQLQKSSDQYGNQYVNGIPVGVVPADITPLIPTTPPANAKPNIYGFTAPFDNQFIVGFPVKELISIASGVSFSDQYTAGSALSTLHEYGVPGYKEGLEYVPRDNFIARLHKGERVLTANESRGYSSDTNGGEVTVHSHIYLDGKEIQTCVSKGFKTNSDLIQSARRAVN
jgi:hypothetical protein